jgi:hypothetical protein
MSEIDSFHQLDTDFNSNNRFSDNFENLFFEIVYMIFGNSDVSVVYFLVLITV